jgi:hypothetical protein
MMETNLAKMNSRACVKRFRELIGCSFEEKYGCHCDLEPGTQPDGCVFDTGNIDDCHPARTLNKTGKGRNDCEYWRPVFHEN